MQKPTAATFTPGARRCSSSTPDFMSATKSAGEILLSAAVASAGSVNVAVPPCAGQQVDRQRRVSDAGEAAGDRADPVVEALVLVDDQHGALGRRAPGPRRLKFAAWARPGDRRGLRPRSRRRAAAPLRSRLRWRSPARRRSASRRRASVSLHAAISAVAAAAPTPMQGQPAHRFASGHQAVDVVGRDLFGDVALQWSHPCEYARRC